MGKYEKRWERMGRQMGNILEVKDLCKTYVIDKRQNNILKNLTILDNILLPAVESKKSRDSRAEKVSRAEALMRKLSIIEVADHDINEVSGGQLQRACICRSMINHPRRA